MIERTEKGGGTHEQTVGVKLADVEQVAHDGGQTERLSKDDRCVMLRLTVKVCRR